MSEKKQKKREPRKHRIIVLLNDNERDFIENYCAKKRIKSKGKFLREAAIKNIFKELHQYSPTLFD